MKMNLTSLMAIACSTIVLSPAPVSAQSPLNITNLSGTVHIQQDVPCGDPVNLDLRVQNGLMEIAARVSPDHVLFDLMRLNFLLTPFSVRRDCMGISATADFREIGLQLATAQRFIGEETGPVGSGLYRFIIPKEQFLYYEAVIDNGAFRQPETAYLHPSDDVTGVIDLRRGTVQIHVVQTSTLEFRAGCLRGGCLINERHVGTQTSDFLGTSTPGTVPPSVACTPVNRGGGLQVSAHDDSGAPVIRLGTFVLTDGEVIQIGQSSKPGVRLVETSRDGSRHFQVGKGESFITATDGDGNVAIAFCR